MAAMTTEEIRTYLDELVSIQTTLSDLFAIKFQALRGEDPEQIQKVTQEEVGLVDRLGQMMQMREKMLARSGRAGKPANSLRDYVEQIPAPERQELQELIKRSTELTLELRQQSWKQWIYIQRSHQDYTEILDLIAHRGNQSPTYHMTNIQESSGGAILDASA